VAFMIFTVFMVCLIATSVVMGLIGVIFDAMRASSAVPTRAVPQADLSLIRSEVLESQVHLCR
jgi:hypothetical protein